MTPRLPPAESLTVEFKSDRKRLSDNELVEAIVCLANAEGGELWLGVEDDGTPTGLHAEHRMLEGLPGLVAARTSPSVTVTVQALGVDGLVPGGGTAIENGNERMKTDEIGVRCIQFPQRSC